MIRLCEACGKPLNKNKRFCSRRCAGLDILIEEERVCPTCKKVFKVKESSKKKFCSKQCASESYKTKQPVTCLFCNKQIIKAQNKKFCDHYCWVMYIKNNPQLERFKKVCVTCGKEYEVHYYRYNDSKYCSRECHYNNKRIIKNCLYCGSLIEGARWVVENKKFCNKSCSENYKLTHSQSTSKWEVELFNTLKIDFPTLIKSESFKIKGNLFYVDMIYNNIIIECFGDYWHCNPSTYNLTYYHKQKKLYADSIWKNDCIRLQRLQSQGYFVFIFWEKDYSTNKELVIQACRNILQCGEFNKNFLDVCNNLRNYGYKDISDCSLIKNDSYYEKGFNREDIFIFTEVESMEDASRGGFGSTGIS